MSAKLYRVVAPRFVAGFLTSDTGLSIAFTAPILKQLRGKSVLYATDYCARNGYKLERLDADQLGQLEAEGGAVA